MKSSRTLWLLPPAIALIGGSLWGGNLVQNGDFSTSSYSVNTEFSNGGSCPIISTGCPSYTQGGGVANWTATGYSLYFIGGTQTTQSAVSIWNTAPNNSTKEMLNTNSTLLSPNGGNFVALDGDTKFPSSISQTVNGLNAGQLYTVSFYWAASQLQSGTGQTDEWVNVLVKNGNITDLNFLTSTVTNPSQGFTNDKIKGTWFQENTTFVASGSSATLTFFAKSHNTGLPPIVLLDGISVNATAPEPATIGLMGAGVMFIGVCAARRRRAIRQR